MLWQLTVIEVNQILPQLAYKGMVPGGEPIVLTLRGYYEVENFIDTAGKSET